MGHSWKESKKTEKTDLGITAKVIQRLFLEAQVRVQVQAHLQAQVQVQMQVLAQVEVEAAAIVSENWLIFKGGNTEEIILKSRSFSSPKFELKPKMYLNRQSIHQRIFSSFNNYMFRLSYYTNAKTLEESPTEMITILDYIYITDISNP